MNYHQEQQEILNELTILLAETQREINESLKGADISILLEIKIKK